VATALLLGAALLSSGCLIPLRGGYALDSKVVSAKSGTRLLVAEHGTSCSVSEKVFDSVTTEARGRRTGSAWVSAFSE
jgi:hypothetical protein